MRKINLFYFVTAIVFGLALTISSCTKEGPTGPAGAAGADGVAGENGTDGTDGVDGNATCLECHTLANKELIEGQYAESGHAAGLYVGYAGGRNGCAMCHSHEGFVETQHTGHDTTAANIPIPTPISCATCHEFHETLDFENDGYDYAIATNSPVDLIMYDGAVTLDLGDNSNLCATCHQPRRQGPDPATGDSAAITSTHYGPHHGPHSTTLEGIGGYELGVGYPEPGTDPHRTGASCVTCHMHGATHTWHVSLDACNTCHDNLADFDYNGVQTDVQGYITDLKQKFIDNGMWDVDEDEIIPDTYDIDWTGAYYNYAWVVDDRSDGVHNPDYIKQLLINSINAFD